MSDTKDDKTLSVAGKTLTLKRSGVEQGTVRQDMGRGRSKAVVVETRKRRIHRPEDDKPQQAAPAVSAPRPQAAAPAPRPAEQAPRPAAETRPMPPRRDGIRASGNLSAGEMDARRRALEDARIREIEERKLAEADAKRRAEEERQRAKEREEAARKEAEQAVLQRAEAEATVLAAENEPRKRPPVVAKDDTEVPRSRKLEADDEETAAALPPRARSCGWKRRSRPGRRARKNVAVAS
jgi:translation initiation factor IF-2